MEANEPVDLLKMKVLERSTAAEQVLHSLLRDDNVEEVELLELREKKGGRGINLGKIAGAEAGAARHSVGVRQSADGGRERHRPASKLSSSS